MQLGIRLVAWFQSTIEELPPDVVEQLPDDVVTDLRDGIIDKIPEDVIERLPESVQDRVPDSLIEFTSANTGFAAFLAVVGVLAIAGFVWGVAKSAVKAAVLSGVVAAAAWYLFFQQ